MRLLVSVRSAAEAETALAGGADIIDAKEPSRGSLGPVSARVLRQICEIIPPDQPVSAALGDPKSAEEILRRMSAVPRSRRPATYLKLGFAGIQDPEMIRRLLGAALKEARDSFRIIAVAYADSAGAESIPPELMCEVGADIGVAGVLLDTHKKGSGNLFTWLSTSRVTRLVADARAAGLLTAVAGGLGRNELPPVLQAAPDIVGFRGAVCQGGRGGPLLESRVRRLRAELAVSASAPSLLTACQ